MTDPRYNSIFNWSCFHEKHSFVQETGDLRGSEYQSVKEADSKIKIEDGEIAWDMGTTDHPGPPMAKKIFGLYGLYSSTGVWHFTADTWDARRLDTVGCVTIKDWEWYHCYDEEEAFTDQNVMARLQDEVEDMLIFINRGKDRGWSRDGGYELSSKKKH